MNLESWIDQAICARILLALAHSLWQGAIVGMACGAMLLILRRSTHSSTRYALLLVALALLAAMPIANCAWLAGRGRFEIAAVAPLSQNALADAAPSAEFQPAEPEAGAAEVNALPEVAPRPSEPVKQSTDEEGTAPCYTTIGTPAFLAPLGVSLYAATAALLLLRLLVGIAGGGLLRRRSEPVSDGAILSVAAQHARAIGLQVAPGIAYCSRVAVPTVVGIVRPIILLPIAAATAMNPAQVEYLILHELAHIRRYDHLINILQRIVEALLFYHPIVWLVSRQIRIEREHCCDDLVVRFAGDAQRYAESLLAAAALARGIASPGAVPALSATGKASHLRLRISRILGEPAPAVRLRHTGWIAGVVAAGLLIGALRLHALGNEDNAAANLATTVPALENVEPAPVSQVAGNDDSNGALKVRVLDATGQPVDVAQYNSWQQLAAAPDRQSSDNSMDTRWIEPNAGTAWDVTSNVQSAAECTIKPTDPGTYRVTAFSVHNDNRNDPTPYGCTEPVAFSVGDPTHELTLRYQAGIPVQIHFVDADSHTPVAHAGFVIKNEAGMPVGYGSHDFVLSSGEDGVASFRALPTGKYALDARRDPDKPDSPCYSLNGEPIIIEVSEESHLIEVPMKHRQLTEDEIKAAWPYVVVGKVVDESGVPMPGVEVRASAGIGTLMDTGRTLTADDGTYTLRFSAGYRSWDEKAQQWRTFNQAAVIFAGKNGYYEKSLCRQGDLTMTDETPAANSGAAPKGSLVVPNTPYQVDFVMLPACSITGRLIDGEGHAIPSKSVVMGGPDLYPASSVMSQVESDSKGQFRLAEIPTKQFWFETDDVRSESVAFANPGAYTVELRLVAQDGKPKLLATAASSHQEVSTSGTIAAEPTAESPALAAQTQQEVTLDDQEFPLELKRAASATKGVRKAEASYRDEGEQIYLLLTVSLASDAAIDALKELNELVAQTNENLVKNFGAHALIGQKKFADNPVRLAVQSVPVVADSAQPAISDLLTQLQDKDWWLRKLAIQQLVDSNQSGSGIWSAIVPALNDEDQRVQVAAAKALGQLKDPQSIRHLVAALKEGNETSDAAAKALSQFDPANVMPLVRLAAEDDDPGVVCGAVKALGSVKSPEVADLLISLLARIPMGESDSSRVFVQNARSTRTVNILSLYAGDRLSAELARALPQREEQFLASLVARAEKDSDWHVRAGLMKVLAKPFFQGNLTQVNPDVSGSASMLNRKEVLASQTNAMRDPQKDVRAWAAIGLGLGHVALLDNNEASQARVTALATGLQDSNLQVAQICGRFLRNETAGVPWKPANDEENVRFLIASSDVNGLVALGQAAVPLLLNAAKADLSFPLANRQSPASLDFVAQALGLIGGPNVVDTLVSMLNTSDKETLRGICEALAKIGDARAVEPLMQLAGSLNQDTQYSAMTALVQLKDPRSYDTFVNALNDRQHYIGQCAADGLGKLGDARAVPVLLARLAQEAETDFRVHIIYSLGSLRDPASVPTLVDIVSTDKEKEARAAAAAALGSLGSDTARDALLTALRTDADAGVRQRAAEALGNFKDAAVIGPLSDALQFDGDVTGFAAGALAKIDSPEALQALKAAYPQRVKGTAAFQLAQNIVNGLCSSGSPAALDALFDLLRDGRIAEPKMQLQAALKLAEKKDPRATEFLNGLRGNAETRIDSERALNEISGSNAPPQAQPRQTDTDTKPDPATPAQKESRLQFRYGVPVDQADGDVRLKDPTKDDPNHELGVSREILATERDMSSAVVRPHEQTGKPSVFFNLAPEAGDRIWESTRKHQGDIVAMLFDGKLICAPRINDPIRTSGVITGDFTQKNAEEIASLINRNKPAKLEIRLVLPDEVAEGKTRLPAPTDSDPNRTLAVADNVILDESGVAIAAVAPHESNPQQCEVIVELKDSAEEQLKKVTGENIGKKLAIILDGKVMLAPTIKSVVGKSVQISGTMSPDEAKALAKSINELATTPEAAPAGDRILDDKNRALKPAR